MNKEEMIEFFGELFGCLENEKIIKEFDWGFTNEVEVFSVFTLDNKIIQLEFDYKTKKIKKTIDNK